MVGLILVASIATLHSDSSGPFWAGLTLSLTGAFVGLTVLGTLLGRGRRRPRWLGAALFGTGYAALIFSRPMTDPAGTYLATDSVLEVLRPWFPSAPGSLFAANAWIVEILDRPIPMKFPNETPLDEVLRYIKEATTTTDHPGLPIYVDPIGLQEAERSMNSTVWIDLEGVPLRTTLALCLKQLGLGYEVKEGYLRITAEDALASRLDDPFLIVGRCLLALLAAGFGALAAPVVAGADRPPEPAAERRSV